MAWITGGSLGGAVCDDVECVGCVRVACLQNSSRCGCEVCVEAAGWHAMTVVFVHSWVLRDVGRVAHIDRVRRSAGTNDAQGWPNTGAGQHIE